MPVLLTLASLNSRHASMRPKNFSPVTGLIVFWYACQAMNLGSSLYSA